MTVRAEPRFVVAKRDLDVTRRDIRSHIPAGTLIRADNDAVRQSPDQFFEPCVHRFILEIDEYERETGSWLGKSKSTSEIPDMPPPDSRCEELWAGYWRDAIEEMPGGFTALSVEVEQLGDSSEFVVRASVDRAAPSQVPEINLDLDQTIPAPHINVINAVEGAQVDFVRDPNGTVAAIHFKSR